MPVVAFRTKEELGFLFETKLYRKIQTPVLVALCSHMHRMGRDNAMLAFLIILLSHCPPFVRQSHKTGNQESLMLSVVRRWSSE